MDGVDGEWFDGIKNRVSNCAGEPHAGVLHTSAPVGRGNGKAKEDSLENFDDRLVSSAHSDKKARQGSHPKAFLAGFEGYLQVDGYAGYHDVEHVTLVACFAHAQRDQQLQVLPQSAVGRAIAYGLNQWSWLQGYLLDGRLDIDNNRSERAIKPFVIGRKGWLFSNTPRGAKASAIAYSIIETAKENGRNPQAYLQ